MKIFEFGVRHSLGRLKRKIWNKRIKLWWARLWIRKDEFHWSLDIDTLARFEMTSEENEKYMADLARRRQLAHQRDSEKRQG